MGLEAKLVIRPKDERELRTMGEMLISAGYRWTGNQPIEIGKGSFEMGKSFHLYPAEFEHSGRACIAWAGDESSTTIRQLRTFLAGGSTSGTSPIKVSSAGSRKRNIIRRIRREE